MADRKSKRSGLVCAIANVEKGLSGGVEDLSAVASLIRHQVGVAYWGSEVIDDSLAGAARALLGGLVGGLGQNARAVGGVLSDACKVI